jgi:NTP pyrophosphatase (non-canonical NTP hydrolase)
MATKKQHTLKELIDLTIAFRDARDWKQFHNPKDSAVALNLEASEVLEHFLWKNKSEMQAHVKGKKKEIADELADVLYWVLLMSHDLKIDIGEAYYEKRKEDDKKYPVEKVKGKHKKYNEYK